MDIPDYGAALRDLPGSAPTDVAGSVSAIAQAAGAVDVVVYLVDFEQTVLVPLPSLGAHVELPVREPVEGTMAGRAFQGQEVVSAPRDEGCRVWAPILEGSDRTGVLALTLAVPFDEASSKRCTELGVLAGCLIAAEARYTDLYNLVRQRKAMSLAASMQWDLLPPLNLRTPEVASAALLEPAYEVGGDCFDHAVNGSNLDATIMDAMGHGVRSSMVASLALGTYRHDRREGQSLAVIHERLDQVLAKELNSDGFGAFVTGQLIRLALRTGELSWINAGHPLPLLVRQGRVLGTLRCHPSTPWGLGSPLQEQASEGLEPGDSVLFYTDGVVEGRSPDGEPFGLDRLISTVERTVASRRLTGELLRLLVHEILVHQTNRLRDDATLLLVTWNGPT